MVVVTHTHARRLPPPAPLMRRSTGSTGLNTLPPEGDRLKEDEVKKLSAKGEWEDRLLIVTSESLIITKVGNWHALDQVPLHEINDVREYDMDNQFIKRALEERTQSDGSHLPRAKSKARSASVHPSHRNSVHPMHSEGEDMAMELTSSPILSPKTSKRKSLLDPSMLSFKRVNSIEGFEEQTHVRCFEIETVEHGFNAGRSFRFQVPSEEECMQWIYFLKQESLRQRRVVEDVGRWREMQASIRSVYESFWSQVTVAVLIFISFTVTVLENEVDTELDSDIIDTLKVLDLVFTIIFAFELLVNMIARWFRDFWADNWNIFDFIVVTISLISLSFSSVPGIKDLRLLRTFRVLRLFGRLKSLRRIISALGASLVPVLNAFAVVLLIMAVYAILGVTLFKEKAPLYFSRFSDAYLTMFTVATVDGWMTVVEDVTDVTDVTGSRSRASVEILFFCSYIMLIVWTLLPVVVAVLLENFSEVMFADKQAELRNPDHYRPVTTSVLDPILSTLIDFENDENLTHRLHILFESLDKEQLGFLSFRTFSLGFASMAYGTGFTIHVSEEDFDNLTENGRLCNTHGCVELEGFEEIMRNQFKDYLQRHLADEILKSGDEQAGLKSIMSALKLLIIQGEKHHETAMQAQGAVPQGAVPTGAVPVGTALPQDMKSLFSSTTAGVVDSSYSSVNEGEEEQKSGNNSSAMPSPEVAGSNANGEKDPEIRKMLKAIIKTQLDVQKKIQNLEDNFETLRTEQKESIAAITVNNPPPEESKRNSPGGRESPLDTRPCDICEEDEGRYKFGKTKICKLCAGLLTDGGIE